jgi:CubicO group peptidase (beta-lactamase class C family)
MQPSPHDALASRLMPDVPQSSGTGEGRMDARSTVVAIHEVALTIRGLLAGLACVILAGGPQALGAQSAEVFADMDRAFDEYRLDAHVPGLVYGIVMDGRLVHVQAFGVQDLDSNRPVSGRLGTTLNEVFKS